MNHYGYCWGNPVGLVDADGNLPTWAKVAIACGAMDAGYQGVQMTWGKQDHFDTAQNMGAMTNGAVFGGLTATGVGFFGTVAAGGISAAGGNMVTQYQKTGTINSREVATATAGGMLGAGIGYGITKCISYAAGRIGNTGSTGNTCPSEGGGSKVDFYVKPNGEAVPGTGYRYFARNPEVLANAKNGMIPARADGTYFSFNAYDDAIIAKGKLQIPYRPEYRVSFDTIDIIDDISIPKGQWGAADYLEPLTSDYKNFGPGGATQAITYSQINSVNNITKLR